MKLLRLDVGLSEKKKILLVEDNAGWHRSQIACMTMVEKSHRP